MPDAIQPNWIWEGCKLAIPSFLAFLTGLSTPFLLRRLTRYFLGPKLLIRIDSDEVPAGAEGVPQWYCRLRILNSKPNIARECRGYVTKIQKVGSHGPYQTLLNESFQLVWSYDEERDAFDLPRGPTPTIDIAMYQRGNDRFHPSIRRVVPNKFQDAFLAAGTYQFSVVVTGHDVDPKPAVVEVAYDGESWPPNATLVS